MASRIKKLFHHKNDDEDGPDSPEQSLGRRHRLSKSERNPAIRQSVDGVDEPRTSTSAVPAAQTLSSEPRYTTPSDGRQDGQLSSDFSQMSLGGTQRQQPTRELPITGTIPRKEVGTGSSGDGTSTSPISGRQKPLPVTPSQAQASRSKDATVIDGPNQAQANTQSVGEPLSAEEILRRAKAGKTSDTTVIEKIAPAVVHETVHRDVHHIRQEVITREIHNHEYYHRILPVIDVEVLPPRHFLPVEGGGLVEISPDEVPGRGQNWVIAETASKIPSGDPVNPEPRRFTAREFAEGEGDAKRWVDDNGVERSETTWVHPPVLETGARETGQTWEMDFGKRQRRKTLEKEGKGKGVARDTQPTNEEEMRSEEVGTAY